MITKIKQILFSYKNHISRDDRIMTVKTWPPIISFLIRTDYQKADKLFQKIFYLAVTVSHIYLMWSFPLLVCVFVLVSHLIVITLTLVARLIYIEDRWDWVLRFNDHFQKLSAFVVVLLIVWFGYWLFKLLHSYFCIGEYVPLFMQ